MEFLVYWIGFFLVETAKWHLKQLNHFSVSVTSYNHTHCFISSLARGLSVLVIQRAVVLHHYAHPASPIFP